MFQLAQVATLLFVSFSIHSLGITCIWIRLSDPRSLRSWCITETDESTLVTTPSLPLMNHDLRDFGLLILI